MTNQNKQQGLVAILTANIIFGLNIPVTKSLIANWMSPMGYTTIRMCYGAMVFWIIGQFLPKDKVLPRDLFLMLIGGLLGFLGTQYFFAQSLRHTTPVIFSLLVALTPVVVLILSAIFLNEGISRRKFTGILLSITGAGTIILLGSPQRGVASNNALGILFAVLCVLSYATYLVMTRKISMKYQPVTIAKWMFLVSAAVALPLTISAIPQQRLFSNEATLSSYVLLAFALLFSTTLAFFLMPVALKRLEASTVSIFMNLQPIIASVVAIAIGQDMLTWDTPLAALLVISGVYLVTTKKRKSLSHAAQESNAH